MAQFDYAAPAELFSNAGRGFARKPMRYHRFSTGAEALRYAIEKLPEGLLRGSVIEVGECRFEADEIRQLYDSSDYPLPRAK